MRYAVRYLSKLGHTKDIANAIAEALEIDAISIIDENKLNEHVQILFLGGAPYANVMDAKLKEYASNLKKDDVDEVILFTTSNWSRRTVRSLKKVLKNNGIIVRKDYFYAHMLNIKNRIPAAKEFALKIKGEKQNDSL